MVKQSQGFTEDTEISKIIFFWARQRKLGKEISQINFFPPVQEKNKNENKNNYPGGGFQMFAGWEDKPLTSPQARSLLFSWDHALILKEGFWSESGQWFYFEQQNEHLRVGSGFKVHSILFSSITICSYLSPAPTPPALPHSILEGSLPFTHAVTSEEPRWSPRQSMSTFQPALMSSLNLTPTDRATWKKPDTKDFGSIYRTF